MNYGITVILIVLSIFGFLRAYKAKGFQSFSFLSLTVCFLSGTIMYWGELWITSFSKNHGPDTLTIIGFLGIILALGTIISLILTLLFQRSSFKRIKNLSLNKGIGVVILLFDSILVFVLKGNLPMIYWWIPLISGVCGVILSIKRRR